VITHNTRARGRHGHAQTEVSIIGDDLYAIRRAKHLVGFVQRVGNVFVALSGKTYSHAVEVGQSLSFDNSVAMVRRSAASA
jgi:hypothetical protein